MSVCSYKQNFVGLLLIVVEFRSGARKWNPGESVSLSPCLTLGLRKNRICNTSKAYVK